MAKDWLEVRGFDFNPRELYNSTLGNELNLKVENLEKEYVVTAEVPGIDKKHIDVEYKNERLTVRVNKEEEAEDKNENSYTWRKSLVGASSSVRLENVKEDNIKASLKDGVITVKLEKLEESKPNKIKID